MLHLTNPTERDFMKKFLLLTTLIITSCCNQARADSELLGTLIGGVSGAWAGSNVGKGTGKVVATGAGAVLGGLIGNHLGKAIDERDRLIQNQTLNHVITQDIKQPVSWTNPDTGNTGRIVVQPSYQYKPCKEYTSTIFVDGRSETEKGTACPNSDGTWSVVK